MSTVKSEMASTMLRELFQFSIYKRSQGKISRQVTAGAMMIAFAVAAWRMNDAMTGNEGWAFSGARFVLPGIVLVLGCWFSFRIVNYPKFADFLIAVEAEMNKVSWPSKGELYRSSFVVIFVLLLMSGVLFAFDIIWRLLFQAIGIIQAP